MFWGKIEIWLSDFTTLSRSFPGLDLCFGLFYFSSSSAVGLRPSGFIIKHIWSQTLYPPPPIPILTTASVPDEDEEKQLHAVTILYPGDKQV